VLQAAGRIKRTSAAVAEADLLANFAHLAAGRRYVRPQLVEEPVIEAVAGRHPVIEQWMEETREGRFISNDSTCARRGRMGGRGAESFCL